MTKRVLIIDGNAFESLEGFYIAYLEAKLERCHPSNVTFVQSDLAAARRGEGQGGAEARDGVELRLA